MSFDYEILSQNDLLELLIYFRTHLITQALQYDPLTGLALRYGMENQFSTLRQSTEKNQKILAVGLLDLDHFKAVNDQYGHQAGDQLLVALTQRMSQTLREADTLARIGGDEFVAIVLDLPTLSAAFVTADRLIRDVARPVQLGDWSVQVSVSVGITFYPQDKATSADQLLRQADHAMYEAKYAGKNRYCVFENI